MQRTCLLIALVGAAAAGHAADVYKWTDAGGVVHYADSEPADAKAEHVHVVGMATAAAGQAAAKSTGSDDDDAGATDPAKKESDNAATYAQQRCDRARQDLELLQSNQPVGLDPARTGKPAEPLDDKQRQMQIANAQTLIAQNCK
jgi:predicted ATPase